MLAHNKYMREVKMLVGNLVSLAVGLGVGSLALAQEKVKNEVAKVKYELRHEICEKDKCLSDVISSENIDLELEKESDHYFWKYKPVNLSKDQIEIAIRLKAGLSFSPSAERSLEVGLAEKQKSDSKQISWGEGTIHSKTWPIGVSMVVKGNEYQLNGKVIIPSVVISFVKN